MHIAIRQMEREALEGKRAELAVLGRAPIVGARARRFGELVADANPRVQQDALALLASHPELDAVLGHRLFGSAPAPFKAVVWLRAARLAEADARPELRRQWLQKVADSGAPQAGAARRQLEAL